ncbi:MAG: VWA domain-containing protein [Acidobacteriota bacterium]
MRFRSLAIPAIALQLSAATTAAAQQIGASRTVLATVVDTRGRSVVDIDVDDFVVRETGQLRDVLAVRVADYPLALVLDNGQGAGRDLDVMRQAAGRFISRVGRRPVAVALSDPPGLLATFDDDRAVVLERLQAATATASSEGLFQAIVTAARTLQETGSPFSAIIVVSATPVSGVPPDVLAPILESGASVHVVVHRDATPAAGQAGGPSSEALRALADETHGQFTTIYAAASYQVALDRLADRIAPELLIDYLVPVGSTHGSDVSVGVRIPGSRVEARGVTR